MVKERRGERKMKINFDNFWFER